MWKKKQRNKNNMASDELSGFAQGFASTFVPTYTKRLADEQNAAIRAADKYSKQEAAIAKAEKEDQDRITAAKDLVRGLKLEGNQFNEAWKWAYGQLKMGINPRNIQTDIREGTLTFPGIEQTTVTLPNESTDVNKQTIATGPVAKYLEDPKKAATATGSNAAYNPYTGGTSARVA